MFVLALGIWLFGEGLGPYELAGALLVLIGVWVAERNGAAATGKR